MRFLKGFIYLTLLITSAVWLGCAATPQGKATGADTSDRLALESRLQPANRYDRSVTLQGEPLRTVEWVRKLYQRRHYQPAWTARRKPNRMARDLMQLIGQSDQDGLNPELYHDSTLRRLAASLKEPRNRADFELLLMDAYVLYTSHMAGLAGDSRLHPFMWRPRKDRKELLPVLETGLASGRLKKQLSQLTTQEPGYLRLKQALARYRELERQGHPWTYVPPGARLQSGNRGERVALLRQRLYESGDLQDPQGDLFDEALTNAVHLFQARHGLTVDGRVARRTIAALNVPMAQRIRQIRVNLQRRRLLPPSQTERHILVNIPDYRLAVMERDRLVLAMNVVVGRSDKNEDEEVDWRTPTLASSITHMILNPQWNVPNSIFKKELLQKIQEDPEYLEKNNMMVVSTRGNRTVDATTLDWSQMTGDEEIRLVQRSGNGNALGTMKFMFLNPYAVYLHDTRAKSLFRRHKRAFSHGCVRVAQPLDLAEKLLQDNSTWTRHDIVTAIAEDEDSQTVHFDKPVALYVQYWTAWADADGIVQFRNDIYEQDPELEHLLDI